MNKQAPGALSMGQTSLLRRQRCLKEAALLLGAPAKVAQQFADSGAITMEGYALHVPPTGPADEPWLAYIGFARPAAVNEAVWLDALLVANGQAMLVDDMAFSLEETGGGVLLMPLPPDLDDAHFLAARLEGLLALCRAVCAGAVACADASWRVGVSA